MKQLFFRPDEVAAAEKAAKIAQRHLYAIVDRRSTFPKPRMYVLGLATLNQMRAAKMFKRMWVAVALEGF